MTTMSNTHGLGDKMKVLLISSFFQDFRYPLYLPSENLGLGYLASYLRSKKIHVEILDCQMLEINADLILENIKDEYSLIGISLAFHLSYPETNKISRIIKEKFPKTHITIGGHFATFSDIEILESSNTIDSVVRGDGEIALFELFCAIKEERTLTGIDGLSYRNSNGNIIRNKDRSLLTNLDILPWPTRDTLNFILEREHPWPTQISTSRGCYGNCNFCSIKSFYGRTWRARSANDVVDEIEWLNKKYNSTVFRLTDDEFIGTIPEGANRALDIAYEIINRKLNVSLMIGARAHAIDEKLFSVLRSAGAIDCLVGVESYSDRILSMYNKGMNSQMNLKAIKKLKSLDIKINLAFIMFDPRMTFDELKANYHFLLKYNLFSVDTVKSKLWPLKGTSIEHQLFEDGLIIYSGLYETKYKYSDPTVGIISDIVDDLSEISFPLERLFFLARKSNHFDKYIATYKIYESLWKKEFLLLLSSKDIIYSTKRFQGEIEKILEQVV